MLVWLSLFRLRVSLAPAVAPIVHAAAVQRKRRECGRVTQSSIATGCPGKNASKSPRWGLRCLRGGGCGECCIGRGWWMRLLLLRCGLHLHHPWR